MKNIWVIYMGNIYVGFKIRQINWDEESNNNNNNIYLLNS